MLGLMLLLAGNQAPEVTPAFTVAPQAAVLNGGSCSFGAGSGHVAVSATVRISWAASNFDGNLHQYKVYQDGVLVNTGTQALYDKSIYGVLTDAHGQTLYAWDFRVDITRISDNQVLATGSVHYEDYYGNCDPREPQ